MTSLLSRLRLKWCMVTRSKRGLDSSAVDRSLRSGGWTEAGIEEVRRKLDSLSAGA